MVLQRLNILDEIQLVTTLVHDLDHRQSPCIIGRKIGHRPAGLVPSDRL